MGVHPAQIHGEETSKNIKRQIQADRGDLHWDMEVTHGPRVHLQVDQWIFRADVQGATAYEEGSPSTQAFPSL